MGHPPPPPPSQARYQRSHSPSGSRHSTEYDQRDAHAPSRGNEYRPLSSRDDPAANHRDPRDRRCGRDADEQSMRSQNRDYHSDTDHTGRRLEQLSLSGSHHVKVCVRNTPSVCRNTCMHCEAADLPCVNVM